MGALVFFFLFMLLIPVGSVIMRILDRLDLMGEMEDPSEWDAPEAEVEKGSVRRVPQLTMVESNEPKAV